MLWNNDLCVDCPTRRYLVEKMKKREGFQLIGKVSHCFIKCILTFSSPIFISPVFWFCPVKQPEFVNVCFWFIPASLRGKENSPDYQDRLSKVGVCQVVYYDASYIFFQLNFYDLFYI